MKTFKAYVTVKEGNVTQPGMAMGKDPYQVAMDRIENALNGVLRGPDGAMFAKGTPGDQALKDVMAQLQTMRNKTSQVHANVPMGKEKDFRPEPSMGGNYWDN